MTATGTGNRRKPLGRPLIGNKDRLEAVRVISYTGWESEPGTYGLEFAEWNVGREEPPRRGSRNVQTGL